MVLYVRESAVQNIPAPSERDELNSLADVDPEIEFPDSRRQIRTTSVVHDTISTVIDQCWSKIELREDLPPIDFEPFAANIGKIEAFSVTDKVVFLAVGNQVHAYDGEKTLATFDFEETIVWIKSAKVDQLYHVFVADDLGVCSWVLFTETAGFTEVKQLNQTSGEGGKAKVIEVSCSDCGTLIACSMLSASESWIQLHRISQANISSWTKEMLQESREASEAGSTRPNLSGNPETFRLKMIKTQLGTKKHDFYSIMNLKYDPIDLLHEETYIYNDLMENAFEEKVQSVAKSRGYDTDNENIVQVKPCFAQIATVGEKSHLVAISCETSDRLLLYSITQKASLVRSFPTDSRVTSFHLTNSTLAFSTLSNVSIFKIEKGIKLKTIISTFMPTQQLIVFDHDEVEVLGLDDKNKLYLVQDTEPLQPVTTLFENVKVNLVYSQALTVRGKKY